VHPLDNPVWSSLEGTHRHLAERRGPAARYPPDVSHFGGFADTPGPGHWRAMEELVGPGGVVIVTGRVGDAPDGWGVEYDGVGVQMTGEHLTETPGTVVARRPDLEVVPLGAPDADDMLELVAMARPGPFSPRTWELGGYVGVRSDGRLLAMAGQRFHPGAWCEISAVATRPDHRRMGLGEHLVRVVAAGIAARGETPFLHAAADNTGAIRLYEAMGFTHRRTVRFVATRVPGDGSGTPTPTLPPVHG
jgi:ribosomal protein S18 acetylase RimI-like enzyme